MGDQKRQYTDGSKQFLITDAEAAELNKQRPHYLPAITPVDDSAKVRSIYRNADGELVDELLPAEAVRQRAKLGENVVADDASIEQSRLETAARDRLHMADQEDLTAFATAALPFSQPIMRSIVGEADANQAIADLKTNTAATLVGNLAEFAIGSKALKMGIGAIGGAERARKAGVILGLNAPAKGANALVKAGSLAAQDALLETHLYVQNQMDTNGPFVAEDWARQVGTGMLFAAPFISGAFVRGAARQGAAALKASGGLDSALGTTRTALQTMAVVSPKGEKAMKYARAAASSGLVGKLVRRVRKGGLAQTDEVVDAARQLDNDFVHARDQLTPQKLDSANPTKRAAILDEFRRYGDEPNVLDDVDFDNMAPSIKKMGQKVESVRREALKLHKQLQGNGVTSMTFTDKARDAMVVHANDLLKHVEDAGMVDVKNAIRRGIIDGGDDAVTMHKALIEAKVNARFRAGVDGGATIVDQKITEFLTNPSIFNKSQIAKNTKILEAVDEVVQVWDDLGEIRVPGRAKDYEALTVADGIALGKNSESIAKLRRSVDTLVDEGLITPAQKAAFDTAMVDAGDAITRGTKGYGDAIKINRARNASLGKIKKQRDLAGTVAEDPASFAEARMASGLRAAKSIAEWAGKGFDLITSHRPLQGLTGITASLHGMSADEKRHTFELVHRELVELAGNPLALTERMGPLLDRGAAANPAAADHAAQKATNFVFYLQSQLPPTDDTVYGRGSPQPLSAIEEFLEKFLAAVDPVAVGYEVYQGTVTPQMVNSLRATSPAMYAEMQVELANNLAKVPADKANPKVLAAAGIFMGGLDPLYSGDFIAALQSNYAQTQTQDQVINGPRRPVNNPGAEASLTTSQRQQTY